MNADNSEKNRVVGRPFKPGQSGNPGGRPSKSGFRQYAKEAIETVVHLMKHGRSEKIKYQAATYLLDQAYGKAAMSMEITGAEFVDRLTETIRAERPDLAEELTKIQEKVLQ